MVELMNMTERILNQKKAFFGVRSQLKPGGKSSFFER
jgi:hypothetical protein